MGSTPKRHEIPENEDPGRCWKPGCGRRATTGMRAYFDKKRPSVPSGRFTCDAHFGETYEWARWGDSYSTWRLQWALDEGRHEIVATAPTAVDESRHEIVANVTWTEPPLPVCCVVCGGNIEQPKGAGRPRETCSDACRAKRSRARRREWARLAG